jgi:hypothetical protein
MTTKILTGVYFSTYDLTSPVTTLSIAASGYLLAGLTASATGTYTLVNNGEVKGAAYGVSLAGKGFVTNAGTIVSSSTTAGAGGVILAAGGSLTNAAGALISGYYGALLGTSTSTLANDGAILATGRYGVKLTGGGLITNGGTGDTTALIRGEDAVVFGLPGTLRNFGTVAGVGTGGAGGVLSTGGTVINGSAGDRTADIQGAVAGLIVTGAAAAVTNYGSVRATGSSGLGIDLAAGGLVVNGSSADTSALIEGNVGVQILAQAGTVKNFGAIHGGAAIVSGTIAGVYLSGGGVVTNGTTIDTSAVIDGIFGAYAKSIAATVNNFGAIGDAGSVAGVLLGAGGAVTNGAAGDTTALIEGYFGVAASGAPLTVANFGTIKSNGGSIGSGPFSGLLASQGGRVTNGGTADLTALIAGQDGIYATTDAFTVTNFGSILGTDEGVRLEAGGAITNGAAGDTAALIRGALYGVYLNGGSGAVTNFGTILAGAAEGFGVVLRSTGTVTNGSATDTEALIQGEVGLLLSQQDTAKNWGTLAGSASPASRGAFVGYKSILTNEVGGLISGPLGAAVGYLATLNNFGVIRGLSQPAVQIAYANARLNAEAGSVFDGQVLSSSGGTVDAVGGVTSMTGLVTAGKVIGAGTIDLNGGASQFLSGASLTVAKIAVAGAATTVEVETSLTDAKVWSQTAGTLTVDSGDKMTFTGVGDSFAGTLTGAGEIAFTGGSDAFANVHLSAATMVVGGASLTLSGTINLSKTLTVTSPSVVIAAAGATLSGGGTLSLTNHAANMIKGASAAATLTNFDRITGAGQLGGGSMVLVNKAGGVINANASSQLTISTGTATITNAGIIENTGVGGSLIASPVANTGTLMVTAGVLSVIDAVTGAGVVRIGGGVAEFGSTFAQNVTFTATSGLLELSHSASYTGKVTGFSKIGGTGLDLLDIAFGGSTKATYSGTTASGVLTVTDGTHTAKIHLIGDYTASAFTPSSDGHGGTTVVDPTAPTTRTSPLVGAMAAFAPRSGATAFPAHLPRIPYAALARPA